MKTMVLGLTLLVSALVSAQDVQRPLTNADVLKMAQAGMASKTIISVIQQTPGRFDTSPDALVGLKKEGISDDVLDAMLSSTNRNFAAGATKGNSEECSKIFDKALAALGAPERIGSIRAMRWTGISVQTTGATTASFQVERLIVYPGTEYVTARTPVGLVTQRVITPTFNYMSSGKVTNAVPAGVVDEFLATVRNDPVYIAQHRTEYKCTAEGEEQIGNLRTAKLKISENGRDLYWNVDPDNGRVLRARRFSSIDGQVVVDFSDWRLVDGIYVPFKRHVVDNSRTTDFTVRGLEINPTVDPKLFQAPTQPLVSAFTFKVLQSQSVPYVVQTNGGISTNCQISGSTSTTMSTFSSGNSTFGTATSTPDLRMNCTSLENSFKWQHVLNAMLVEASDGNAYIIACDRAWRWSKCSALSAGDTFNARRTDKGLLVQFFNTKEQEKEATYAVLQSRSLR
jgi:hypothetical protein